MDWMNQLGTMLNHYNGTQQPAQHNDAQVQQDFDHVAQSAPPQALAQGLNNVFLSPQTPPFGTMTSQLYSQSNPQQRASLLNTLVGAAGPTIMGQLLSRSAATGGQSGGALGNLGGLLGMLGGGTGASQQMPHITPDQAMQVSPQAVEELASHAQQHNPSIVDQISNFYAEQPALVKGLGAAALIGILAKLATPND